MKIKMKKINALFIFFVMLVSSFVSSPEPVEAYWQCVSPRNTAEYDYLLTEGTQDRAECIRGRLSCPVGWGDNCAVGCNDTTACGDCECRCQGSYLYCADIWRASDGDLMSQSCIYTAPSSLCVPTALITSPIVGSRTFNEGTSIYFNGKGTDPNGESIIGYRWIIRSFEDNANKNYSNDIAKYSKSFSISTLEPGSYYVYFKVQNKPTAWSSWVYISINILEVENPPVANITVDPARSIVGDTISFVGTSSDSDGDNIAAYRWLLNGDGSWDSGILIKSGTTNSETQNYSLNGAPSGSYTMTYCALYNGGSGWSDSDFVACDLTAFSVSRTAVCPNDVCETGETVDSCPADCSTPPGTPPSTPVCGDTVCDSGENTFSCFTDCTPSCSNFVCESGENAVNCPDDCPISCGDDICSLGETEAICPGDCSPCGDGVCSVGETEVSCPADCSVTCGDGFCGETENPSCSADCGAICGDGNCDTEQGENFLNCHADCRIDYREI